MIYDIKMGNDIDRDIHCYVTMSNEIAMSAYHDITMHNAVAMNLFYCVLLDMPNCDIISVSPVNSLKLYT